MYWGFIFVKVLPCRLFDKLGSCALWVYNKIATLLTTDEAKLEYFAMRYQLLAAPDRITILKKFGDFRCCSASFTHPALPTLLSLKIPVAFCYGLKDDVIPAHQGAVLSCVVGSPVPFYLLPSWHEPAKECPEIYLDAIQRSIEEAALPGTDPASLKLPVYGDKDWPVITYDCCLANETTFDEFYQRILTQHSINHNCDDISEIEGGRIVDMCEVGAGYPPKPSTKQDGIGTDGLTPRRSSHQHRPECCPVNL